jgi:folate-dependent phosphoribosylglycinamide formyltransferase PurN
VISFSTGLFTGKLLKHFQNVVNFHLAPLPVFVGINAFKRSFTGVTSIDSTVQFCNLGVDRRTALMLSRVRVSKNMERVLLGILTFDHNSHNFIQFSTT